MNSVQVNNLTYSEYDFIRYKKGIIVFTPYGRDSFEIGNIMRMIQND